MLTASLQADNLQEAARLIFACKITLGGPRVFQILAPGCRDAPTWHRAAATLRSCEARTPGEQKSRRERQRNTGGGQRSMETCAEPGVGHGCKTRGPKSCSL